MQKIKINKATNNDHHPGHQRKETTKFFLFVVTRLPRSQSHLLCPTHLLERCNWPRFQACLQRVLTYFLWNERYYSLKRLDTDEIFLHIYSDKFECPSLTYGLLMWPSIRKTILMWPGSFIGFDQSIKPNERTRFTRSVTLGA